MEHRINSESESDNALLCDVGSHRIDVGIDGGSRASSNTTVYDHVMFDFNVVWTCEDMMSELETTQLGVICNRSD